MLDFPVVTVSTRRDIGPDECYFYSYGCPVKERSASDSAGASGLHVKPCQCELKIRESNYRRYLKQVQRHMILFHGKEGNFEDRAVFEKLMRNNDLILCKYKPLNALESMREQQHRAVIKAVEIPRVTPPQPPLNCRPLRIPQAPPRSKQSPPVHQFYILHKALTKEDNKEEDHPSAFHTCCSFSKNLMTMEKDLERKAIGFYNLSEKIDDGSQKERCVLVAHGCQALYSEFNDLRKTFQKNAEQMVAQHVFLHENAKPHARHLPTQAMTMLPNMLRSIEELWQGEREVQHGADRTPDLKQLNLKKVSIRGDACTVCADWHAQHIQDREIQSCRQGWTEHVQKEHDVSDMDEAWQYCRAYIAQSPEIRQSKKRRKSYDQGAIDVSLSSESDTAGDGAGKKEAEILRRLKTLCCESPCDSKVDNAYLVYDPVRSPQMLHEADEMLQDAMEASIVVASCLKTVRNKGIQEVEDWMNRCHTALQQYRQSIVKYDKLP